MSKAKKAARHRQQQSKSKGAPGIPKKAGGVTKSKFKPNKKNVASSSISSQKHHSAATPNTNHHHTKGQSTKSPSSAKPPQPQTSQTGYSVPFSPSHKILLVGEGDFSFSLSLLRNHKCQRLTCTTLESRTSLLDKHPQTSRILSELETSTTSTSTNTNTNNQKEIRIIYNIDATALIHPTRGGGAALRRLGPFDRIVFNFPHTGGLTKDVNRQVRANQELVAGFLGCCAKKQPEILAPGGRVVVTLFEGEPYELWGIRNLARHVGLAVVRSCRFEWDRYPGYSHARTLGNIRGGGGWKGEEREARMYIFSRPGEEKLGEESERRTRREKGKKKKKGPRGIDSDSDDEFDSEYDDGDGNGYDENEDEDEGKDVVGDGGGVGGGGGDGGSSGGDDDGGHENGSTDGRDDDDKKEHEPEE